MKKILLTNVADVVKTILETNEAARNNNNLLICLVINEYGKRYAKQTGRNPFTCNDPFIEIIDAINKGYAPSIKTILRVRRKVQELSPDLKANKQTQILRSKEEDKYIEFAHTKTL